MTGGVWEAPCTQDLAGVFRPRSTTSNSFGKNNANQIYILLELALLSDPKPITVYPRIGAGNLLQNHLLSDGNYLLDFSVIIVL